MPLARHDCIENDVEEDNIVSTHMPLARHDSWQIVGRHQSKVSTHMPLARHDSAAPMLVSMKCLFLLTCLLRGMTPQ